MIPEGFKPLLAIEHSKVKTAPANMYMSEKLDGIRCVVFGGVGYSRSLKPIPNASIQAYFKRYADFFEGMDGELIVGNKNAPDVFNQSTSGVMRHDGEPDFTFWVFDKYHPTETWLARYAYVKNKLKDSPIDQVVLLEHFAVEDMYNIDEFEVEMLAQGAEGIMLRDADAKYKCGRSGTKNPELHSVINRRKNSQFQTRSEHARNWSLKKKYNIDLEEFNLLWIVYKGRCGICSVELKLPEKQRGQALDVVAVDHNHITGKVRGLLCNACNKGLGLFKDSIENLEKAKEYLNVRS